ncbi:MAG: CBS domain-containing protein [Saprospiraceae bacterium]|nr:CBS domain-containing protein [Saprospiraceae bacterium]MCF8251996.1 CBS domain-containing protein [Saprospiraceae bacterium]MCF8281669.1 CBS domain-containing protein [Bacteroidales bacterium]MCF8313657.1 CBS domain-containing protein [Saprospiraceae bacterium]MCF8442364.1 CBS domain-containing protein [Saprospiraceae bacterium]
MGAEKVAIIKDKNQRLEATAHLLHDLKALEMMINNGVIETDVQRIGAEQEVSLVGKGWGPAPVLMDILGKIGDERFTTELAQFNMEINLEPLVFTGDCLSQLERNLWRLLVKGEKTANLFDAHLILVGILPTLHQSDLDIKNITPSPRYQSLLDSLHEMRGDSFEFRIEGKDQWIARAQDSFYESSNTSFQVHYQLQPDDFAAAYNWALAITAPVLACATNSPIFLGKRLWRETRIALFQQSTDVRSTSSYYRERSPRVDFGTRWVNDSVLDIYRENATRHKPIFISTRQEDALKVLEAGGVPNLHQLCIHNGTVYNWNRACYGITEGEPHLRIENRALPAGPTIIDEVANAAFWLGLMKGMPPEYAKINQRMDFDVAKRNFLYAAQLGLGSNFYWNGSDKQIRSDELILKELLPIAKEGLAKAAVNVADADRLLGIIEERVKTGKTGSQWTLDAFQKLSKETTKDDALIAITAGMSRRQQEGSPVHTWDLPEKTEAGNWKNRYWTIEQIMKTELFTVNEDEPVQLAANMMYWKNIRHLPVENNLGELTGLVTCKLVMLYYSNHQDGGNTPVREIMEKELITVSPQTKTVDALELLKQNYVGCLPVLHGNKLAGLVTERDFMKITAELLKDCE